MTNFALFEDKYSQVKGFFLWNTRSLNIQRSGPGWRLDNRRYNWGVPSKWLWVGDGWWPGWFLWWRKTKRKEKGKQSPFSSMWLFVVVKDVCLGSLFKMLLLHQTLTAHHFPDNVHRLNRSTVHIVHVVVERVAIWECCSEINKNRSICPCKDRGKY